jgi:hypothetical protein
MNNDTVELHSIELDLGYASGQWVSIEFRYYVKGLLEEQNIYSSGFISIKSANSQMTLELIDCDWSERKILEIADKLDATLSKKGLSTSHIDMTQSSKTPGRVMIISDFKEMKIDRQSIFLRNKSEITTSEVVLTGGCFITPNALRALPDMAKSGLSYAKIILKSLIDAPIKERENDLSVARYMGREFSRSHNQDKILAEFNAMFEGDKDALAEFECSAAQDELERNQLGMTLEEYAAHKDAEEEASKPPKTVAVYTSEDGRISHSVFVGACDLSGRPVFKARKSDDHAGTAAATEIEGDATTDNHFAALIAQYGAEAISNEWDYEFVSREPLDSSIPLDLEPRI